MPQPGFFFIPLPQRRFLSICDKTINSTTVNDKIADNTKMDSAAAPQKNILSPENIRLGKLLLAVADMQLFVTEDWTSAPERHSRMPTSAKHFTRSQMRQSSVLVVRARPLPQKNEDEPAVSFLIRRKKLTNAWEMMQSCDPDLWTDVCSLHAMIKAVEQDQMKFGGLKSVLEEVAEAKKLMRFAEILAAVDTIESYRQEEWSNESAPTCIRRGSMVVVHDEHHAVETAIEAKVRHAEHSLAWQKMKSCSRDEWIAACRYHEDCNKRMIELEAAVSIIQDYDTSKWSSENLLHSSLPTSMRHAASLATRVDTSANDEEYKAHRKRLVEAWQTMKEASPGEWTNACKSHEDVFKKGGFGFGGIVRTQPPVRKGVSGTAA